MIAKIPFDMRNSYKDAQDWWSDKGSHPPKSPVTLGPVLLRVRNVTNLLGNQNKSSGLFGLYLSFRDLLSNLYFLK